MKINKNQALYRALPSCWTTYSDSNKSDYKYACKVVAWNTKRMDGINEELIRNDIYRRVLSFKSSGGCVKDDFSEESIMNFEFVEPAMNESIPDIRCEIEPKTFYCQKCGKVSCKVNAITAPFCDVCKVRMNQLQMVYACECGFAEGVKPNGFGQLYYRAKDKENQFKFFTSAGKKSEMERMCPICNKQLFPKNATDSRLFYSHSGNHVNLYNKKYADLIETYKFDAELLMMAKWFDIIDDSKFKAILEDPKSFFEPKIKSEDDPEIQLFASSLGKTPREIIEMLASASNNVLDIFKVKKELEKISPSEFFESNNRLATKDLLEFDTLKYPISKVTLKEAIDKCEKIGYISDEEEITELLNKNKIKDIQISESVQIVNYAYGFTRLRSCPDGSDATSNLRLRGFNNKVFCANLETEGLLIELDMLEIFKWLQENDFVSKDIELTTDKELKKWFLSNVHLDTISHFSTISGVGENKVTKIIYSLLHTISHMAIISAGNHSGLSRDSISEIIFPETCSVFIYPTSSEGITLGSISGMFESSLKNFLQDMLKENEICTFDPVCSKHQNGACVACTYLSEVNCAHFNKDLSRSYLYGGTIKINEEEIVVKKGFWK